ncbi:MAG: CBS domain-containing protein, partial [Deltaproteobacteria bacterium]|nr:CBS domain-containing protein [Deltaproteobacteria bacterium]
MTSPQLTEEPSLSNQNKFAARWYGDNTRKAYLLRRQRKEILENCRRVAVAGASSDPENQSFIAMEKLLGMGLELIPVCASRESLLGVRCYERLRDVPGKIDIVVVFPDEPVDCGELAKDAVEKQAGAFWLELGLVASPETLDILVEGRVQLVEHEELVTEYLKHTPVAHGAVPVSRREKKGVKVKERMTRNPERIKPDDGLKDAKWKMERGHFRHLPVVEDSGKLVGMITDRDIRLIRPSLAFVDKEDAMVQLWSISVQQAAVFDPISVKPETTLKEAAELMLR